MSQSSTMDAVYFRIDPHTPDVSQFQLVAGYLKDPQGPSSIATWLQEILIAEERSEWVEALARSHIYLDILGPRTTRPKQLRRMLRSAWIKGTFNRVVVARARTFGPDGIYIMLELVKAGVEVVSVEKGD